MKKERILKLVFTGFFIAVLLTAFASFVSGAETTSTSDSSIYPNTCGCPQGDIKGYCPTTPENSPPAGIYPKDCYSEDKKICTSDSDCPACERCSVKSGYCVNAGDICGDCCECVENSNGLSTYNPEKKNLISKIMSAIVSLLTKKQSAYQPKMISEVIIEKPLVFLYCSYNYVCSEQEPENPETTFISDESQTGNNQVPGRSRQNPLEVVYKKDEKESFEISFSVQAKSRFTIAIIPSPLEMIDVSKSLIELIKPNSKETIGFKITNTPTSEVLEIKGTFELLEDFEGQKKGTKVTDSFFVKIIDETKDKPQSNPTVTYQPSSSDSSQQPCPQPSDKKDNEKCEPKPEEKMPGTCIGGGFNQLSNKLKCDKSNLPACATVKISFSKKGNSKEEKIIHLSGVIIGFDKQGNGIIMTVGDVFSLSESERATEFKIGFYDGKTADGTLYSWINGIELEEEIEDGFFNDMAILKVKKEEIQGYLAVDEIIKYEDVPDYDFWTGKGVMSLIAYPSDSKVPLETAKMAKSNEKNKKDKTITGMKELISDSERIKQGERGAGVWIKDNEKWKLISMFFGTDSEKSKYFVFNYEKLAKVMIKLKSKAEEYKIYNGEYDNFIKALPDN